MTKIIHSFCRFFLTITLLWFAWPMLYCGSSSVQLDPTGDGGPGALSCDDTGEDVATGDLLAVINGNVCKTPAPWLSTNVDLSVSLILSCTTTENDVELARNTTDSTTDNTTATCGTGDGADTALYFCTEGVVYKEETGTDTALFSNTKINCTVDGDDVGELSEEAFEIS